MNQVSDFALARAVQSAGAFPSISIFNYYRPNFRLDLLELETSRFNSNFLLSLSHKELSNIDILDFIVSNKITAVEILEKIEESEISALQQKINLLRSNGILVFLKIFGFRIPLEVDGVIIKGSDGAGRSRPESGPLENIFEKLIKKRSDLMIIPSGGISTAEQVKYYIDLGATMVGIGTLFAASQESSISIETKNKLIEKDSSNLSRFSNGQQGLIFNNLPDDDYNHTRSLIEGIKNPQQGHIFVGKGIDHIQKISTVAEIVQNLIKLL